MLGAVPRRGRTATADTDCHTVCLTLVGALLCTSSFSSMFLVTTSLLAAMLAAPVSASLLRPSAGDAARAAAAAARLALAASPAAAPCLPRLHASGILAGAQYSRPAAGAAANRTDALFGTMLSRGANLAQISLPWGDVESTPGAPNFVLVAEILSDARARGLVPLFQLAAIDTEHAAVPSDLADADDPTRLRTGLAWNSTEVIDRFATVLEVVAPLAVFSGAPYIGVGNEVSVNLGQHPETGYEFAEFVFIMKSFIQQITAPDVAVGVTLTVGDIGGWAPPAAPPDWGKTLFDVCDLTPLTYYPLGPAAHVVTDAAAIARAVNDALDALPQNACVVFQEFGCPSGYNNASSTDGSNDAVQAAFIRDFRAILTAADAKRPVRAASLYQMVDMAPADCEGLAKYYNVSEPAFIEYLCSLGAVRTDGTPKPAWTAFLDSFTAT